MTARRLVQPHSRDPLTLRAGKRRPERRRPQPLPLRAVRAGGIRGSWGASRVELSGPRPFSALLPGFLSQKTRKSLGSVQKCRP